MLLALPLRYWGLEGLLASFVIGHVLLLAGMWMIVLRSFPLQQRWIAFDFTQRSLIFPALIGIGVLYNLASGSTSSCSGTTRRPRSRSSAGSGPR